MRLRVGHDEVRLTACAAGTLTGQRQHRRGDVQAGAVRLWSRRRGREQAGAGTAANVHGWNRPSSMACCATPTCPPDPFQSAL
ncbi:hypothetical protein G6F66_015616 [Rhizopus arrhizus]|nr:hypothetical protein G6F66_015616 [Rhizopus arrhizus]